MINLELPKNLENIANTAKLVATGMFRPISRKYDSKEHAYPKELDQLAKLMAANRSGGAAGGGAPKADKPKATAADEGAAVQDTKNGSNMVSVASMIEMCWGDVGLALTIPGQGLGNAAISAVATEDQKARFGKAWASMAITEPEAGSDSAAIRTTAKLDGDEWVINGEKIFVTAGERCNAVVVWATIDPDAGRAAIKSFVVEKGTEGMEVVGLEKKLGIRASDTATIRFTNCRIPKDNILGSPEIKTKEGFGGVMKTFDNTRPMVAAMSLGCARAALDLTREILAKEGVAVDYENTGSRHTISAAQRELYRMEGELETARLLTMKSAWMADNGIPNSMEASMAKAKAGRVGNDITLSCVALCGGLGYGETELLEKWARDSKILDIFEGTQQIQMLIVARRLLNKTSAELK